jgi:hypothetical protein
MLQLVLELIYQICLPSTMQQYQDYDQILLKFFTALHVSACSAIIRCIEIRMNCCDFRALDICMVDGKQN